MTDAREELEASLRESATRRAAVKRKFGFVPSSVLRITRGSLSKQMFIYQHEVVGKSNSGNTINARDTAKSKRAKEKQAHRMAVGAMSGQISIASSKSKNKDSTAIMAAELVEFFAKFYAKPGDVFLDPFVGKGIEMQVAKLLGMQFHGYEISNEFFRYLQALLRKIDDGKTTLAITREDSRFPDEIPDGIGDFSFHSPPYWDVEFYGDEVGQLGYKQTYEDFLDRLKAVAEAWLPKFKSGSYYVVNVADFRRGGRFYPYSADTIRVHTEAGWIMHDMWIIDGLIGGTSKIFAARRVADKLAPRTHEYAIVFRRP